MSENQAPPPARITLELDSSQVSVAPGSNTTFSLRLKNNGLTPESLKLSIEGLPTGWISTPSPVTKLEPGEEREIPVTVAPQRAPESRAGRHPFVVQVTSEEFPDQIVTQEAILTLGAFSQFESDLQPQASLEALQNAQVEISNQGNVHESFQITWQSDEDLLAFELVRSRKMPGFSRRQLNTP